MKFYVMSEVDFEAALHSMIHLITYDSNYDGGTYEERQDRFDKAEAACRAREVFPVPAHEGITSWVEIQK